MKMKIQQTKPMRCNEGISLQRNVYSAECLCENNGDVRNILLNNISKSHRKIRTNKIPKKRRQEETIKIREYMEVWLCGRVLT